MLNRYGEVVGVVTQPDRPRGRDLRVAPCPVREHLKSGTPVLTPESVNAPESVDGIRALRPDLVVVVAYGQLLGGDVLAIAARGVVNVHASLLPRYRGAAPVQWAIARGERVTGATIMFLARRMDAGDIILQEALPIEDSDTGGTLHDKLAAAGAALLLRAVDLIRQGQAPRAPQDETAATFAPKLKKSDGRIAWSMSADEIRNRVRAFNPWPCATCEFPNGSGLLLRVMEVRVEEGRGRPGEIIRADDELVVAAGRRALRLLEVQPEGGKIMGGGAFLRGHRLKPGDMLG